MTTPLATNKMSHSAFDQLRRIRRPYYILAPDYARTSAGTRALHLLCHYLNQAGQEAYIDANLTAPDLRTPRLTTAIKEAHKAAGRAPIAVYPEIVHGNPLKLSNVVRYILNHPGVIGGPLEFPEADLLYFYSPEYRNHLPEWPLDVLRIPLMDRNVFHPPESGQAERHGNLIYPGRTITAEEAFPEIFENATVITGKWPASHPELADLLRSGEKLYTCANSAIVQEALLCGCPVVFLETPYSRDFLEVYRRFPDLPPPPGIARDTSDEELSRAIASVGTFAEEYAQDEADFTAQLYAFIEATQALSVGDESQIDDEESDQFASAYPLWLWQRHGNITRGESTLAKNRSALSFHLIVRLSGNETDELRQTLASLDHQHHDYFHIDIVSTGELAPDRTSASAYVSWHQVSSQEETRQAIDGLVERRQLDWIVELPSGAILDPLCLWRLTQEIQQQSEASAFFVDDDLYDDTGSRMKPRFKPGMNVEWLRSSDLAGPLFIKRDVWRAIGGAAANAASPWFGQLMRVVERFGWQTIRHVPDVLVSYPGNFPSDAQTCLTELARHLLTNKLEPSLSRASETSWRIGYTPARPEHVTICIASQGRLELLNRTINSLLEHTDYPSFDIVISIPDKRQDGELAHWLDECRALSGGAIQHLTLTEESSFAAQCCQLSASASGELILFTEEGLTVQEKNWLTELAGVLDQQEIAAVSPRIIDAVSGQICRPWRIHALAGTEGAADIELASGSAVPDGTSGIEAARDASILSGQCLLVRKSAYDAQGGISSAYTSRDFTVADLCLRWRESGQRLVCTPLSSVLCHDWELPDIIGDKEQARLAELAHVRDEAVFSGRWLKNSTRDPYWNPNFSLSEHEPAIESRYAVQWQHVPSDLPKIATRPLPNSQGDYRINYYLDALSRAGRASACTWQQSLEDTRQPTLAEICRLGADSLVVQNYTLDHHLAALHSLRKLSARPFVVHSLDDLVTNLDPNSPFARLNPSDARTRLKYALAHSDRLVVSTDFLAESFCHLIDDIRVVPNRLPGDLWLPLRSERRTGKRPRIGWAGGITHHTDLMLLKEVVAETRAEADWIFFGMCPPELRPLVAEFHEFAPRNEYPRRLAALNLDLAVAPLADTPFNNARSNLRLLEYGVLGIPVVCSNVEPYRGSPACCVENTTENWLQALRERIHDADTREEEGRSLRRWVRENYLIENHMDEWLAAHLP